MCQVGSRASLRSASALRVRVSSLRCRPLRLHVDVRYARGGRTGLLSIIRGVRPPRGASRRFPSLSIPLPAEDKSKSFKSVVHPSPKVWMHHLEIRDPDQVDDEVAKWLRDAYDAAS